tara:strand:- start:3023 stop:4114 length:1092 start_codon:yes stop_codon:yes gene_type:complete
MSSLLEQAIIDANDLRTAALKSAESTILERYSTEVKNAVDSLLEQEMLPTEEEEMLAMADPMAAEPDDLSQGNPPEMGIPMGAAEEQPLCPCPDDEADMEIEFKLEDLLQVADEMGEGDPFAQEELAMAIAPELAGEAPMPMPGEEEEEEEDMLAEDLDIEIPDELFEKMVHDMGAQPTGWATHPGDSVPTEVMEYEEDLEKASQMDEDEESDESNPEKDALDIRLAENLTRIQELEKAAISLVDSNKNHKALILRLKEKLEEVNLSNARLLYTNRTLNSPSLNERQKSKIVDSIQKSDSIEEAKVIFETLQSAVGAPKRRQESLNEVIKRPSTTMPRRRRENAQQETAVRDRFQRLAGISQK